MPLKVIGPLFVPWSVVGPEVIVNVAENDVATPPVRTTVPDSVNVPGYGPSAAPDIVNVPVPLAMSWHVIEELNGGTRSCR